MMSVKHSVADWQKIEESVKPDKERKEPRQLGPPDLSVQLCCDSIVAEKWIYGHYAKGDTHKEKIGRIQKTQHSWWKRQVAYPVGLIDDNVKHTFREHYQEAHHPANLGAEEQRKVTSKKRNTNTEWRAVRGLWDGSKKTDGRSGCEVVIKGVDRDKWITVSKIAVPLKTCAAMIAVVTGVDVLTEVQALFSYWKFNWEIVNGCIDQFLEDSGTERDKKQKVTEVTC